MKEGIHSLAGQTDDRGEVISDRYYVAHRHHTNESHAERNQLRMPNAIIMYLKTLLTQVHILQEPAEKKIHAQMDALFDTPTGSIVEVDGQQYFIQSAPRQLGAGEHEIVLNDPGYNQAEEMYLYKEEK